MNCLIVNDQRKFRAAIKRLLELDSTLVLVGECDRISEVELLIANHRIDLVFFDIEIPGIRLSDLAPALADQEPLVIFTTSVCEYTVGAFEFNVVDFLLKPISPARFLKAIVKAKQIANKDLAAESKTADFVFIRDSNIIRKLRFDDILYFEATGDYVKIVLSNNVYFIHSSLKIIEQKVPEYIFLRIHRSFIINLSKIDTAEGKTLVINQSMVPISDAYKADLNKRMNFL